MKYVLGNRKLYKYSGLFVLVSVLGFSAASFNSVDLISVKNMLSAATAAFSPECARHEGYVFSVSYFGVDGNTTSSANEAFTRAFACIRAQSEVASAGQTFELYIPPGEYVLSDKVIAQDPVRANQTLVVSGAGPNTSIVKVKNSVGAFDIRFSSSTPQVVVKDISLSPEQKGAGVALSVSMPDPGALVSTNASLTVRDVNIQDRETARTFNYFTLGIKGSGLQNPVFDNVRITGPYGPQANAERYWYKMDANIELENVYAPYVMNSSLWNANRCLVVNNTNPRRSSGSVGARIDMSVMVGCRVGASFSSLTTEPEVRMVRSHFNAVVQGVVMRGPWSLTFDAGAPYSNWRTAQDVDLSIPFYFFDVDGVRNLVLTHNIFQESQETIRVGGNPDINNSVGIRARNTSSITLRDNVISKYGYMIDTDGSASVTAEDNTFLFGTTLYKAEPLVTVTAPAPGAVVEKGSTQIITWNDTVMSQAAGYYVTLRGVSLGTGALELTASGQGDTYTWIVANTIPSGKYSIQVCRRGYTSDVGRCDQTDGLFSVQ